MTDENKSGLATSGEMSEWDWCWLGDHERGERFHRVRAGLEPEAWIGPSTAEPAPQAAVAEVRLGLLVWLSRLGVERCRPSAARR